MNYHVQPIVIIGSMVCITRLFFIEWVYNLEIIILNMTAQRMLWTKRCKIVADIEALIDIFRFCKHICYIL